jgi:protein-tyrosine phosphatase
VIDLHAHLLPGLDDGAPDLEAALEMARMAVADGITHMACTPHIMPGVYDNDAPAIEAAVDRLAAVLGEKGVELGLLVGADVRMDPLLSGKLASGDVPTLNGSRYFLFEPPHDVAPPRCGEAARALIDNGFVPILTHPERLSWIENHYDLIVGMAAGGALIQLTAGSITGHFGRRPKYWSERMLDEGLVFILASDAHNTTSRPPMLSAARDAVAERLGEDQAWAMVAERPAAIANDQDIAPLTRKVVPQMPARQRSGLARWVRRRGISER